MRRIMLWTPVALLFLWSAGAMAGGFNIYEMGSRATALGGAFTATADDPSAIFYNPAGTAYHRDGWALSVNVSPVLPRTRFTRAEGITGQIFPGDPTSKTKDNAFFPTGAYLTYKHDEHWSGGFGFFTPFGLGVEWDDPESFAGRPVSINSHITGLYFSPTVTYSPMPRVALSVGVNLVTTSLTLERIQPRNLGTDNARYDVVDVELEGTSGLAASPSAAIMFHAHEKLACGINFKGGVTNEFENDDATFTVRDFGDPVLEAAVEAGLAARGEQKVSADLDFPAILMVGARFEPTERMALMADFVWFDWSAFDEVILTFTDTTLNSELREDYTDGQQWRFGAECEIMPGLRGMIGFVYDNSPQPVGSVSPTLPDANRLDYSIGLTCSVSQFEITAGYMFVDFDERSTVVDGVGRNYDGFDGAYDSIVHIPTIGATYYF